MAIGGIMWELLQGLAGVVLFIVSFAAFCLVIAVLGQLLY